MHDTLRQYEGITLVDLATPKKKSFEAIVHTFRAVLEAKKLKADIIHIHAVGPALLTPVARLLGLKVVFTDRKSTRLNSSHTDSSRMPSSA